MKASGYIVLIFTLVALVDIFVCFINYLRLRNSKSEDCRKEANFLMADSMIRAVFGVISGIIIGFFVWIISFLF